MGLKIRKAQLGLVFSPVNPGSIRFQKQPRKATQAESNVNKRRQSILRSAGYKSIKVDGNWGPWQQNI